MSSVNTSVKTPYRLAGIVLLSLSSPLTQAEEDTTAKEEPSIKGLQVFNRPVDKVSNSIINFANWADGFFGSNRIYQESQGSYLKINLVRAQEEGEKPAYSALVRGKLSLPKTQDRLKLILESDPEESALENQPSTLANTLESQEQSLGLRYIPIRDEQWRVTTDAGVRFRSGLDSFARFRVRRLFPFDFWTVRLSESIFWYDSTGAGETTRLEIDRPIDANLLFRSATSATWMKETRYFDLSHDFLVFQNLDKHQALLYQAGIRGISEPDVHTTDYILSLRYRKLMHSDWLYFEINPKINFPEENDFDAVKSIFLSFEIIFGDS